MNLTPSQQKTLDVFFYRSLRRILKIPPTHIDRAWTNARVLARARTLASHPQHPERKHGPTPFAEYYGQRRTRLLGHLLRENEDHLGRATIILPSGRDLAKSLPKRVGRPRTTWLEAALAAAKHQSQEGSDTGEDDLLTHLQELAIARQIPFRWHISPPRASLPLSSIPTLFCHKEVNAQCPRLGGLLSVLKRQTSLS